MLSLVFSQAEEGSGRVGCELANSINSKFPTVEYVVPHGPAATAGIKLNDCIVTIDDVSTEGISTKGVHHLFNGDVGASVKLTVRGEDAVEKTVIITRQSLLDTCLPAANEGDARAQFDVGNYFENSPKSERDESKAFYWYRKAADNGNASAQTSLGRMYASGIAVDREPTVAASWYLKAAKQGEPEAEKLLARCYYEGVGVPQNYNDAFAWFYSAAQQEDWGAEVFLGILYEKGQGVTQNKEESRKWFKKAHEDMLDSTMTKIGIAITSLKIFLEGHDSSPLNTMAILSELRPELWLLFSLIAAVYFAVGLVLFYFSLKSRDTAPKLPVAIGWILFSMEAQGVALLSFFILGKQLTADLLMASMAVCSALPVIASSCGPWRNHVWKSSSYPWKKLVLYFCGSWLMLFFVDLGYEKIYVLVAHVPVPPQPTINLFIDSRKESAWLAFASIALAIPIAEEIIFRSYLFDALRRRFSGELAIGMTALVFAAAHFQAVYFVPLFGLGLILGWLRYKTGSLHLSICLHIMNNGLFLLLAS